jgi:hypothetical protein
LTDLDRTECAPLKVQEWFDFPKNRNLIFRIAVREVESWLLADRRNFANFMGVPISRIPELPEDIPDPKALLFDLARHSNKKIIKEDIPPESGSGASDGKNYNGRLIEFVTDNWDIDNAKVSSVCKSLTSAITAFRNIN